MNLIKYQEKIDRIVDLVSSSVLFNDATKADVKNRAGEFVEELQTSRYIKVPIVGYFNAGKSSLLNMFTQKPSMLPINILPETAVACEIYYSENEIVDLYRKGNKVDTKPLAEIKSLDTLPGDIIKVYCNSPLVKQYQDKGIVLVDMPGLGSGIERHDAAIFNYIHTGTAFVLVVDVEQGMLKGSILSFVEELSKYNMAPAILVSKIDQVPEQDVQDIVDYITYQTGKYYPVKPYVSIVCAVYNKFEGLIDYLAQLDAKALVCKKLDRKLKLLVNSIIEQINIRINLRTQDIENAEEQLQALEQKINDVKVELPVIDEDADTPEKSTQDVLDKVELALEAKSRDIAQMIINKEDKEEVKEKIVSIVRAEIMTSLEEESTQYSTVLGTAVQEYVTTVVSMDINVDFEESLEELRELTKSTISECGETFDPTNIWDGLYVVFLYFLPDVVNWLFGMSEDETRNEIQAKIKETCANNLIPSLRPVLLSITKENQKRIQEQLQSEVVAKMENVKEGLREKIADAQKTKAEIEKEIFDLKEVSAKLSAIFG